MERARLTRYGVLSVKGDDARAFLHAQLTSDIEHLSGERAALAGWCSAKGRLLATFLVIPAPGGFLLQLARDLAPTVAKRLGMFILRAKVKIADESDAWVQYGIWNACQEQPGVRVDEGRFLQLVPATEQQPVANADETQWALHEIRAGRPFITAATQDQFVPQMVNLEKLGAIDFHKGCYPGQEIVARAQYRGQVKRRMVHVRTDLKPGEAYNGGVVVDSAAGEALAVMPV